MWLLGDGRRPGIQSEQRVLEKLSTSLDFLSAPPPPPPRRGRESEGWEEQFFPISGHQREKVWRWGWGWSRKLGLEMIWKENRKKCSESTINY